MEDDDSIEEPRVSRKNYFQMKQDLHQFHKKLKRKSEEKNLS